MTCIQARWASDGLGRIGRLVAVLPVLLMVAACGLFRTPTMNESTVVGRWLGEEGGVVEFAADGTFVATDLRREVFEAQGSADEPAAPVSGDGTWTAPESGSNTDGRCVDLKFTSTSIADQRTYSRGMYCEDVGGERLYFLTGDPDLGASYYYFSKEE